MMPAGGALVLASTACAQIALEPRVRVPLDGAGCRELPGFLETPAGRGRSAVLITSRISEDWLGGIRRIAVGGLASHEVTGYAEEFLAPCPAAALRPGRARKVRRRTALEVTCPHVDGHLGHVPDGPLMRLPARVARVPGRPPSCG